MSKKKIKIMLELTEKEAALLVETLCGFDDRGPSGSGWQSDELASLSSMVDEKVEKKRIGCD